jgi:hypothetical protein
MVNGQIWVEDEVKDKFVKAHDGVTGTGHVQWGGPTTKRVGPESPLFPQAELK